MIDTQLAAYMTWSVTFHYLTHFPTRLMAITSVLLPPPSLFLYTLLHPVLKFLKDILNHYHKGEANISP